MFLTVVGSPLTGGGPKGPQQLYFPLGITSKHLQLLVGAYLNLVINYISILILYYTYIFILLFQSGHIGNYVCTHNIQIPNNNLVLYNTGINVQKENLIH